ncbi:hypothetical protein CEXT_697891 [Caerostris extrusa]|uniref:Uncharacterized protein n=1 Tax=Caerostris extrusa TaxID=172846 RepID=A0AAV4PX66_CAEEX|nr:hypothetical protein CEXT_697891 [Caerostris extrusa]
MAGVNNIGPKVHYRYSEWPGQGQKWPDRNSRGRIGRDRNGGAGMAGVGMAGAGMANFSIRLLPSELELTGESLGNYPAITKAGAGKAGAGMAGAGMANFSIRWCTETAQFAYLSSLNGRNHV